MPRPHRPFLRYCRCFSHCGPCRQGRCILSKKPSDSQLRGSQRRRQNRRCCPAWSARRAAVRRCSPPVHGFCTPVELIPPLIVLVGGRVNAEGTVRVAFGVVFLGELAFRKGLRVVLLRVRHDGCGIHANEGGVHDPHLIEFLHLCRHNFFQCNVIYFFEETVIRPVGRQQLHDVEPAVMGNESVVI